MYSVPGEGWALPFPPAPPTIAADPFHLPGRSIRLGKEPGARPSDWMFGPYRGLGLKGFQKFRVLLGANTVVPTKGIVAFVARAVGRDLETTEAVYLMERAACASPEVHRVSEWRHRCLSRLTFPRSPGQRLLALSMENRVSRNLRSASSTPLGSLGEQGPIPTVAGDAILTSHRSPLAVVASRCGADPTLQVQCVLADEE
jgi:hypothetical protein